MISYLVQVSICMTVFYAFYHFALRKETLFQLNRMYLLITLVLSLLLPLIKFYMDVFQASSIAVKAPELFEYYIQNLDNSTVIQPADQTFSWGKLLLGLYFAGVVIFSIRFIFSWRAIWRVKLNSSFMMVEDQACVIGPRIKSPFSFLDLIYLPAQHEYSKEELHEVICHERAHVRGRHSWDVIFLELVSILLWLSPLIYLYKKSIKEIHEFIADAAVVKTTHWETYSEFLIHQKAQAFQTSLVSEFNTPSFRKRIGMMAKPRSSNLARLKLLGMVPVFMILMGLISCQQARLARAEVPATDTRSIEKVDTISVNDQQQYFMNGYAITEASLPGAMRTSANHNLERMVIFTADEDLKIQDITGVFDIAKQVDARLILLNQE